MSIITEIEIRKNRIKAIAEQMLVAARTAPKGRGRDTLELLYIDGEDLQKISIKMDEIGINSNVHFFVRDAENIRNCEGLVLIGSRIETLGLQDVCQLCGFANCIEKEKFEAVPCVYNVADMNIAIGSAVSIAADFRVDNRVMFSVGKAAIELKIFESDVKIAFGIALSIGSKNIFFDRK